MKNKLLFPVSAFLIVAMLTVVSGCGIYSFSGAATAAKTIQVDQFFNNTDLAPANIAQTVTNRVKDYFQQNSSLRVVSENGELQIDGVVTRYDLTPMNTVPSAQTATSGASNQLFTAAQTRLTIVVKCNYVDNTEPKNSFKDKNFTFYKDFDSGVDFSSVQEDLEKQIFDQILIDIFNATVANW